MNNFKSKYILITIITLVILFIISILLAIFTKLSYLESFRIVFGSVYVLFLPGFIISYIFFQKTKPFDSKQIGEGGIDIIERLALSFALSIAVVPLIVFYLNLIGIRITLLNTFLTILGIIIISLLILYFKNVRNKKTFF